MSTPDHTFILARHGKKVKTLIDGFTSLEGTVFREECVTLNEEGVTDMFYLGETYGAGEYALRQIYGSGFPRVSQSAVAFAEGAGFLDKLRKGYDGDDIKVEQRNELALTAHNAYTDHKDLDHIAELWDSKNPVAFNSELYEGFFGRTSHDDKVPVMGRIGAGVLNLIARSIAYAKNNVSQGENSFIGLFSHATNVDALSLAVPGVLQIRGDQVEIDRARHTSLAPGTAFVGYVADLHTSDPELRFYITADEESGNATVTDSIISYRQLIDTAEQWNAFVDRSEARLSGPSPYIIL